MALVSFSLKYSIYSIQRLELDTTLEDSVFCRLTTAPHFDLSALLCFFLQAILLRWCGKTVPTLVSAWPLMDTRSLWLGSTAHLATLMSRNTTRKTSSHQVTYNHTFAHLIVWVGGEVCYPIRLWKSSLYKSAASEGNKKYLFKIWEFNCSDILQMQENCTFKWIQVIVLFFGK